MNISEIEKYLGNTLPQGYKDEIISDSKYKIEYKEWPLFSESELMKEINLSGHRLPYYKILEGYFKIYDDVKFKNKVKLKKAIAISDENSDILFFDNHLAVYIFFHSSLEVIKVANSFEELKKFKIVPEVFENIEPPNILGLWSPESSETHDIDFIKRISATYQFFEDGTGTKRKEKITWKAVKNNKDSRVCILLNEERKIFLSNITENTFLYSNEVNDLRITYMKRKYNQEVN